MSTIISIIEEQVIVSVIGTDDTIVQTVGMVIDPGNVAQAALDRVQTGLDVLTTNADVLLTHADAAQTALDRISTSDDVLLTHADVVLTHADVVLTHADVASIDSTLVTTATAIITLQADMVPLMAFVPQSDDYATGPLNAVNNNVALFDQGTGKMIKDSGIPSTSLITIPVAQPDDTTPQDTDYVYGKDGTGTIRSSWTVIKAFFKTYTDTLYSVLGHTHITETIKPSEIQLPKTSGAGIKVDITTPTWGWRDLEGVEITDVLGANAATLTLYQTPVREYAYSVGDIMDIRFHIPHDLVPNTDMFIHFHWSHIGTAISGNMSVNCSSTYAKGHNQANFPAPKVVPITYATTNIATTPAFRHRIEEAAWSSAGGSATLFDTALLEVDGLILMNLAVTAIPTITGGTSNEPFIHRVDLHYQSTNIATKAKAPNFYV